MNDITIIMLFAKLEKLEAKLDLVLRELQNCGFSATQVS